jgi:hypothetical protein
VFGLFFMNATTHRLGTKGRSIPLRIVGYYSRHNQVGSRCLERNCFLRGLENGIIIRLLRSQGRSTKHGRLVFGHGSASCLVLTFRLKELEVLFIHHTQRYLSRAAINQHPL